MWDDVEVVPMRPRDRRSVTHALRELGLLVAAAAIAAILPLIG